MTRALSPIERRAASATEAEILRAFTDLEDKAGLGYVLHARDARGQRLAGLTDTLVILPNYINGDGILGFFEIKTQRDQLRDRQRSVLAALHACNRVVSGIVRLIPREGEMTIDEALRLLGVELT